MGKQIVTLIGTFRKDSTGLSKIFDVLKKNHQLISPKSISFIDKTADFVKARHEANDDVNAIEERVLSSILKSDFVWLFCPSGYVGLSTAFEIGFAHSAGVPIFTDHMPQDEMMQTMITKVVKSPASVPLGHNKPGRGICGLQSYYEKVSKRRGWDKESARDTLLLLTEEVGELARVIRKTKGLKRHKSYQGISLEDELADIQLYLVHLANITGVELGSAVNNKEKKNQKRYCRLQ